MKSIKASLRGLIAAFLAAASPANAADIRADTTPEGTTYITIDGTIRAGDDDRFRRLSAANPGALIGLSSDGGALLPALEIGRIIHQNDHPTVVLDGDTCASACALIWLAGTRRGMQPQGRIGFHAAYRNERGAPLEDGVANALVGRYLTQLNLPVEAVVFATAAPPDRLLYLDYTKPDQFGINFVALEASPSENRTDHQTGSSADGPETSYFSTVAHWEIRVDHTLNNRCYIAGDFEDGTLFRLGLSGENEAYIQLLNSSWRSVVNDSNYTLQITFGSLRPWSGSATGINRNGNTGLIVMFDRGDFIRDFMGQQVVTVAWNGRQIARLDLEHSSRAIQEMARCQQQHTDPFRSSDPFAH